MITKSIKNIMLDLDEVADGISWSIVKNPNNFTTEEINSVINDQVGLVYARAGFLFWSDPNMSVNFGADYSRVSHPQEKLLMIGEGVSKAIKDLGFTDPKNCHDPLPYPELRQNIIARRLDPSAKPTDLIHKTRLLESMIQDSEGTTEAGVPANSTQSNSFAEQRQAVREIVWDAICTIPDPDVALDLGRLGLVEKQAIKINIFTHATDIVLKPTTPNCGIKPTLARAIRAVTKLALMRNGYNYNVNVAIEDNTHISSPVRQNEVVSWENLQKAVKDPIEQQRILKMRMLCRVRLGASNAPVAAPPLVQLTY